MTARLPHFIVRDSKSGYVLREYTFRCRQEGTSSHD